ncbi:MAG: hypothetical protein ABIO46_14160, partial [Chitinophagales bacterium]
PPFIRGFPGTPREMQWGGYYDSLLTDVPDPNDGLPLMIWDLFDMRVMYRINKNAGVPYMAGVHGKNDITLGWVEYYYWYDSLEVANQGGVWFWDQRKHNGNNKNFTDGEASINFDRFYSNRSYPAFSHCSINQDWGNGLPLSGDPYGAWNGYLDWEDASITDLEDSYSIRCFIKDMYVNGNIMTSYNNCTTDLTLRRVQHFNPLPGELIDWTVKDVNGQVLNSGTLPYTGLPVTLHNINIKRDGSTVLLKIQNPMMNDFSAITNSIAPVITIETTGDGYLAHIISNSTGEATLQISDALGRPEWSKSIHLEKGTTIIPLHASAGLKLFNVTMNNFEFSSKLIF